MALVAEDSVTAALWQCACVHSPEMAGLNLLPPSIDPSNDWSLDPPTSKSQGNRTLTPVNILGHGGFHPPNIAFARGKSS